MKSDVVACGDIIKSCYCVSKVKYFTGPCFEEICYVNFSCQICWELGYYDTQAQFSIIISLISLRDLHLYSILYKGSNTSKHLIFIMKANETNVSMIIKINSYDMWSMGDIDKVSHNICKTNTLLRIFMYKTLSCNCSFSCGLEKEIKLLNMNTYFYTWSIKGFILWCKLSITNLREKTFYVEIMLKYC